jgi:hypothetical protein
MQLSATATGHAPNAGSGPRPGPGGALLAAALALPGVAPPAAAYDPPDGHTVGVRHLDYRDAQPGLSRVRVSSPSVWYTGPVGEDWSIAASGGVDAVSGASPRWHTAVSGASSLRDRRVYGDLRLTRHADRMAWTVGIAQSDENDYRSRAASAGVRIRSEDGNTEWSGAAAFARDRIDGADPSPIAGDRRTLELSAGVTRVASTRDIVALQLGLARADGTLSDPYKYPDRRPDRRDQVSVLLRWNHHIADGPTALAGSTLRTQYRHYRDSWGVRAHTLGVEWVRPLAHGWTFAPLARLHSQSAARFYFDPVYDPVLGAPFPPGFASSPDRAVSPDQRLSAFGALAAGLRVAWRIDEAWTVDMRAEWYRQQGTWRIGGEGSPGLARLEARILQFGASRRF